MRAVCLISGGIDSPVAAYLMLKKGWELVFVHMETGESGRKRTEEVVGILRAKFPKAGKLYVVPHRESLEKFAGLGTKYTCVLCKRMLLRVAEKIAGQEKAGCILNGDNLAQVASQTLQNLAVVSKATTLPIVRPLIGYDKQEAIDIARKIGTFESSINRVSCCEFVPEMPSTSARLEEIEGLESGFGIGGIVDRCVEAAEVA